MNLDNNVDSNETIKPIIIEPVEQLLVGDSQPEFFDVTPPKNRKSKKGLVIILVILFILVAAGTGVYFFKDKLFAPKGVPTNGGQTVTQEVKYINFSESRKSDNLAIPLRWGNGYYILKLNGEGFGNPLVKKYEKVVDKNVYTLSNDNIKILSYFNVKSEPSLRTYGLWGNGYIEFSIEEYNERFINGDTEFITYQSLSNENGYYLVLAKWNDVNSRTFYIKKVIDNDVIVVNLGNIEPAEALAVYQKFVANSEFIYLPLDDKWNVLKPLEYEEGPEVTIDLSNWTFLQSLIWDLYKEKGLRIQNSPNIQAFNSNAHQLVGSNAIYYFTPFVVNEEYSTAGIMIRETNKEALDKVLDISQQSDYERELYSNIKETKCNAFKRTIIIDNNKQALIYVQTDKDEYFVLNTGISYDHTSDESLLRVINILEQIFL